MFKMFCALTISTAMFATVILIRIYRDSAKAAKFVLLTEAICVAFYNPSFHICGTSLYLSIIILYFGMLGLLWPFKGKVIISRGIFALLFLWIDWILLSLLLNRNIQSVIRSGLLWGLPLAGFVIGYCAIQWDNSGVKFPSIVNLWYKLTMIAALGVGLILAKYLFRLPLSWIPLRSRGLDPEGIIRLAGIGAGANPNPFADYTMIGFFTSLGLLVILQSRFHQMLAGFSSVLFSIGLLMSNSRGAMLGVTIGGVTWLVWSIVSIRLQGLLLRRLIMIAVMLGFVLSSSEKIATYAHVLLDRMVGSFPSSVNEIFTLRDAYYYYWSTFTQSPFLGKGLGWFGQYPYIPRSAHNIYLQLLSEGGILAFFIGSLVLFIIIQRYFHSVVFLSLKSRCIQLPVLWLAYGAAFIGLLTHGLFENTLTQIQTGWWIGVLLGILWNAKEKRENV